MLLFPLYVRLAPFELFCVFNLDDPAFFFLSPSLPPSLAPVRCIYIVGGSVFAALASGHTQTVLMLTVSVAIRSFVRSFCCAQVAR